MRDGTLEADQINLVLIARKLDCAIKTLHLDHTFALLVRSICRPFSFRARRSGWRFPALKPWLYTQLVGTANTCKTSLGGRRTQAYATLFFELLSDFPEPSQELSPRTRRNDATAQSSIGPACDFVRARRTIASFYPHRGGDSCCSAGSDGPNNGSHRTSRATCRKTRRSRRTRRRSRADDHRTGLLHAGAGASAASSALAPSGPPPATRP